MYERLFCWIVGRINDIIEVKNYDARIHGKNTVIGVLDIYGFEIFQNNRFLSHIFISETVFQFVLLFAGWANIMFPLPFLML